MFDRFVILWCCMLAANFVCGPTRSTSHDLILEILASPLLFIAAYYWKKISENSK